MSVILEAIAQLIAALVAAIVEALMAFVQLAAALLAMIAEFLFLLLTHGLPAASEKYKQRKADRETRKEAASGPKDPQAAETRPSISLKKTLIISSMIFVSVGSVVTTLVIQSRILQQQIQGTHAQVAELADSFVIQIKDKKATAPEPGELVNRDAWKQPIELFVDKVLLASLVVVRSSGPDRKPGTIDDILAIRVVRADAKEAAGDVAQRGINGIRDRVARLLPKNEKEKLPKDMDVVE